MRYPNMRYGNPAELNYYAMAFSVPELARLLRRDERTVRDWLSCKQRVPWWVPEILRLKRMEAVDRQRQMNMAPMLAKLGVVSADVITLTTPAVKEKKPQLGEVRPDDFEPLTNAL